MAERNEKKMLPERTKFEALLAFIKFHETQEAAAAAIGVSQPYIHKLKKQIKELPVQFCKAAERSTNGAVPAWQLQPAHFDRPANYDQNVSGEWTDEYGNQQPILDRTRNQHNGAVA